MHVFRHWLRLMEGEAATVTDAQVAGVWYHGTPYAFDEFDVQAGEFDTNHDTPAIFLTNDPDLAESYASRERQPMQPDFPYGEMKRDFIVPIEELIAASTSPAAAYLSRQGESILNGRIDFAKAVETLADIAAPLQKMKNNFDARIRATHTTAGANIRPCTVTGIFMHVKMLTDFNAGFYDLFMAKALEAGLAGVCFHDVVDSPSGGGPPADILAVFDGKNIRPKFALLRDLAAAEINHWRGH